MAKGGSEPVDAGRERQEVAGEYRRAVHMGTADPDHADTRTGGSWRAGCVETRTPGSEGGLRKRTGRKTGTAPQPDPYKNALQAIKAKVRTISRQNRNQPLAVLLHRLNLALRGWCVYFRHGCSARTFRYLGQFTWERTLKWLRRKHPNATWKQLRRRYLPGWWPTDGSVVLANPEKVTIIRYRYRGAAIPTPWTPQAAGTTR